MTILVHHVEPPNTDLRRFQRDLPLAKWKSRRAGFKVTILCSNRQSHVWETFDAKIKESHTMNKDSEHLFRSKFTLEIWCGISFVRKWAKLFAMKAKPLLPSENHKINIFNHQSLSIFWILFQFVKFPIRGGLTQSDICKRYFPVKGSLWDAMLLSAFLAVSIACQSVRNRKRVLSARRHPLTSSARFHCRRQVSMLDCQQHLNRLQQWSPWMSIFTLVSNRFRPLEAEF